MSYEDEAHRAYYHNSERQGQEDFYDLINNQEEPEQEENEGYLVPLAVIDASVQGLFIYDIYSNWNDERIELFLTEQGRRVPDCEWLVFDGNIIDLRNE